MLASVSVQRSCRLRPRVLAWTPHVAGGVGRSSAHGNATGEAMLDSGQAVEVLLQLPGETTLMSTYNHWYCAWRSTEAQKQSSKAIVAPGRQLFLLLIAQAHVREHV